MSVSSDEEDCSVIDPFTGKATQATTQEKYKVAYKNFMEWKADNNYESCTETIILEYFTEMSKKYRPTTLWCTYSKLRSTVKLNQGIDIGSYSKLLEFLKRHPVVFRRKNTKVLSMQDIERFLKEAPDSEYLATKVALIFGINGSCSCKEICSITINDVEEHGKMLLIKVKNTDKTISRTFFINGKYYQIVKKYMNLRSKNWKCDRFFQHYIQGKYLSPMGTDKIGEMPKNIAKFLGLPNPDSFNCRMFRRFSKMIQLYGEPNLLSRLDRECQSNTDKESYNETIAERTESVNRFSSCPPPELHNMSDETLALQKHEVNSDYNNKNYEDISDKSDTKIEVSNHEVALLHLPDSMKAVVKADPDLSPVRPSNKDPLSPAFENTEFDNIALQNLCQTDKASEKNIFIFNNCTFNKCFKSNNK